MRNYFYLLCFLLITISLMDCKSKTDQEQVSETKKEHSVSPLEQTETPSKRFEAEIQRFETLDKQNGYSKNSVLFTGSSSIRMWSTLEEDMKGMIALNRGFGGSTIREVLHYADRYIFNHEPQIIVFYCGENDITEGASPDSVFSDFVRFVELVESKLPDIKLIYISMKPSPDRWHLWEKFEEGNEMIRKFIDQKNNIQYMDAGVSMLGEDGQPKPDIFIEDGLHMNEKGYEGWTRQLLPVLEKIYKE